MSRKAKIAAVAGAVIAVAATLWTPANHSRSQKIVTLYSHGDQR